jgi:uncharacterized membrane protein
MVSYRVKKFFAWLVAIAIIGLVFAGVFFVVTQI